MENNSTYTPINCSFYDILEAHATKKDMVEIVLKNKDDDQTMIKDIIKNFETRKGEEFAVLSSGIWVRLDTILSVNGWRVDNLLFCS